MSSITIQKILNDNGLGTRHDRWLALEQANAGKTLELSAEQMAFLEKRNPCSPPTPCRERRAGRLALGRHRTDPPSVARLAGQCDEARVTDSDVTYAATANGRR